MMLKAKARYSYRIGRIIVDDCPYCHRTHYHNHPIDSGQRMADCFQGEYILDFEESAQSEQEEVICEHGVNIKKYHCVDCGTLV